MTSLHRSILFVFFLSFVSIYLQAQVNGDYRTRASGNWTANNVWQRYNNGNWSNITTAPTSANGAVTILHNIDINTNATASKVIVTGATVTIENGNSLTTTSDLTLSGGDMRVSSSALTIISATVTIGGDLDLSGNSSMYVSSASLSGATFNINAKGDVSLNGTSSLRKSVGALLASSTMNFTFNGTSTQVYTKAASATVSDAIDFEVAGGSVVDFTNSSLTGSGSFALNSTGKIIAGNSNPIQVTGSKTFNNDADYEFKGSSTWSLCNTARNVTINNTSGNVSLSAPLTITNNINFQNGVLITTSSNLLTINDNATATGFSNSSFVAGPVKKKGNDNFIFPIGRTGLGAGLIPIGISGLSTSSDFTAEYKRLSPKTTLGNLITASGLDHISNCEYWNLDRVGSATANVTMYWNTYSNCNAAAYVNDLASIVAVHFNGTSWNAYGRNGGTTGNISSGSVTWNNVSAFSPFALGSTSPGMNPLAVAFTDVRAIEKNNGVQIEWTNSTEKNIERYVVERSFNGNDFSEIDQKLPVNNQNDKASYTSFDMSPQPAVNYYRVKAIELSGVVSYTKVLKVTLGNRVAAFSLYPNPATGNTITASFANLAPASYTLKVVNNMGQVLYSKVIKITQQGSVTETLNLSFANPGIYKAILTGGEQNLHQTLMIR